MRWIKVDKGIEILISLRWYPGERGTSEGWWVGGLDCWDAGEVHQCIKMVYRGSIKAVDVRSTLLASRM